MLYGYVLFHLNLAFSSLEEEQREVVVRQCYWPLVRLASERGLPIAIELTGFTLSEIARIDPSWVDVVRDMVAAGRVEVVGSGLVQLIGPLVPHRVNAANLRFGHDTYRELLGVLPTVALVNEQAYSAGIVQHYVEAGYEAIVMEWDNAHRRHPEWDPALRYVPQVAVGCGGEEIPILWCKSIAFQKMQRYVHGELEMEEYLAYLDRHSSDDTRIFPLYANDAEVFDFRPGRFATEPTLSEESEWERLAALLERLVADDRVQLVLPTKALAVDFGHRSRHRLHLESTAEPIPVKKQGKYNISRWAVTGRDDLSANTRCWRIHDSLVLAGVDSSDPRWRDLCLLWASDFRTHITGRRWAAHLDRLSLAERESGVGTTKPWAPLHELPGQGKVKLSIGARSITLENALIRVELNTRRGLAVSGLWLTGHDVPLCGTIPHGYFDDIGFGSDWYTGHVVAEIPGKPKITDLQPVAPVVGYPEDEPDAVAIESAITTPLGIIRKRITLRPDSRALDVWYRLEWPVLPLASLRLGTVTLMPEAFDRSGLRYQTHNGGSAIEEFALEGTTVDQGSAVSFLVSASAGVGMTEGWIEFTDGERRLRVEADRTSAAVIGLVSYREVGDRYFCRLALSASEVDDTRKPSTPTEAIELRLRLIPG